MEVLRYTEKQKDAAGICDKYCNWMESIGMQNTPMVLKYRKIAAILRKGEPLLRITVRINNNVYELNELEKKHMVKEYVFVHRLLISFTVAR